MPSLLYVHWQLLWDNLVHFGAPDTHRVVAREDHPARRRLPRARVRAPSFGKRVLAQLNPFDLVVLLTLSNTVQNAIIGNDTSLSGRHPRCGGAARRSTRAGPAGIPGSVQGSPLEERPGMCAGARGDSCRRTRCAGCTSTRASCSPRRMSADSIRSSEVETHHALPQRHDLYKRKADDRPRRDRFDEIIRRLTDLSAQVSALRR